MNILSSEGTPRGLKYQISTSESIFKVRHDRLETVGICNEEQIRTIEVLKKRRKVAWVW